MRHLIGPVEELPEGEHTIRRLGKRTVGVFHTSAGFHAVLDVCPHRGAPVCQGVVTGTMLPSPPGEFVPGLDGLVLRCPWHGWEFDLRDGTSIGPVDRRDLKLLPTAVEDGRLYVDDPD